MFNAIIESITPNCITRYSLTRDAAPLTYAEVLDLWQSDSGFRDFFRGLLSDSPFAAYRWETPMLNTMNSNQPFQFVLFNAPSFPARNTDHTTYSNYFTDDNSNLGIVSFQNLSGDATLVIPSPRTDQSAYGHLAAFIRLAPKEQSDALWRILGKVEKSKMSERPLWLSTAGGGVAWLHVRIDSRPKYYAYSAYKNA